MTFGDGSRRKVLGRGLLCVPGMPKLDGVLLVEGLKANLISISQLYDQDLFVKFTKGKCSVLNQADQCVMEGKRSSDNCYLLTLPGTCLRTQGDFTELWNRRLKHLKFWSLRRAVSVFKS